jgi:hypothetical protein
MSITTKDVLIKVNNMIKEKERYKEIKSFVRKKPSNPPITSSVSSRKEIID